MFHWPQSEANGEQALCVSGASGHNMGTKEAKGRKDERLRTISNSKRNPLAKNNVPSVSFKNFHNRWAAGLHSPRKVKNNRADFSYSLGF